jgi:hypothetical protein
MNEQIKKLVKQLGPDPVGYIGNWGRVEWADNVYPQLGDQMYAAIDLEKFAELIVKECASVLLKWKGEPFPFDENLAASLIKEHFGVKE